jgi:signal transduction histidine kinase
MKSESNKLVIILMGIIIILSALFINDVNIQKNANKGIIINEFNSGLSSQLDFLNHKTNEIFDLLDKPTDDFWPLLERVEDAEDFYLYVYKHDSLLYWNNSSVYFPLSSIKNRTFLKKNANNWYLGVYGQLGDFRTILLEPIISRYNVDNQFVKKVVNPRFSSCNNIRISAVFDHEATKIDFKGKETYYLSIENEADLKNPSLIGFFLICILYILIGLLLIHLSHYEFFLNDRTQISFLFSLGVLLLFRIIDIELGFSIRYFPKFLTQGVSSYYFSFVLGDLLIFLTIFSVFAISAYKNVLLDEGRIGSRMKTASLHSSVTISYFVLNVALWILVSILKTVKITDVYFFVNGLNGWFLTFWISIIGILFYANIRLIGLSFVGNKSKFLYASIILSTNLILAFLFFGLNYYLIGISLVFVLLSFAVESITKKLKQFYVLHHLIYVIVISSGIAIIINQQLDKNRFIEQISISRFLSNKGDKNIEDFWADFILETNKDKLISDFNKPGKNITVDSILDHIEQKYFNEKNPGFSYQITYCANTDNLRIGESEEIVNCSDFFDDLKYRAISKPLTDFYLLDNEPDNIYYLGNLKLSDSSYLYIEIYSYFVPGGLAYAELLVDNKPSTPDLSDFSFAKYHQNVLTNKFGDFEYHTTLNVFSQYPDSLVFEFNDFLHFKTHYGNDELLIVSRPINKLSSKIFSFSYFFIALALFIVLLTSIVYSSNFNKLLNLNLRARLQMFFMIALSTITISTALIILYYTEKNNTEKLHSELNEKAHSVLIELQHKLSSYRSLDDVDGDEVTQLLQKFSMVFFSDINLYDTKGKLLATSRPQIFEGGFLSELINPKAYEEILVDNLLFYNCTEKIGSLEYYSTYLPLLLNENKAVGVINLPFFARQTEQKKSFRFLLFTFINLFVILGILGTFVAVFYSRFLTKPLSVLQQNISNIRIGVQNAKIQWNKDDEIGQLISEYNKMVDKLEASSDLLKRSERELAWREMARQIAHEIKNPLTPMKLNIQYLMKSKTEDKELFESKFKDISSNLIEQIETLDRVAEMFSDMAKSNTENHIAINLLPIIDSIIELYNKSGNIQFEITKSTNDTEFFTRGTKKDLTQIFSNLVKNSVEAIGNTNKGKISINIKSAQSYIDVELKDNGKGIPPEVKSMVFTPYFTTRTKGTGLGLAIVKSLITGMGGDIKLEKSDKEGTIFLIKFLKTKATNDE